MTFYISIQFNFICLVLNHIYRRLNALISVPQVNYFL